jgi:hypothetical protein
MAVCVRKRYHERGISYPFRKRVPDYSRHCCQGKPE